MHQLSETLGKRVIRNGRVCRGCLRVNGELTMLWLLPEQNRIFFFCQMKSYREFFLFYGKLFSMVRFIVNFIMLHIIKMITLLKSHFFVWQKEMSFCLLDELFLLQIECRSLSTSNTKLNIETTVFIVDVTATFRQAMHLSLSS